MKVNINKNWLESRAGSSTKNSSIERVRVPQIAFERVSSGYLKFISSTRVLRVLMMSTRVVHEYQKLLSKRKIF